MSAQLISRICPHIHISPDLQSICRHADSLTFIAAHHSSSRTILHQAYQCLSGSTLQPSHRLLIGLVTGLPTGSTSYSPLNLPAAAVPIVFWSNFMVIESILTRCDISVTIATLGMMRFAFTTHRELLPRWVELWIDSQICNLSSNSNVFTLEMPVSFSRWDEIICNMLASATKAIEAEEYFHLREQCQNYIRFKSPHFSHECRRANVEDYPTFRDLYDSLFRSTKTNDPATIDLLPVIINRKKGLPHGTRGIQAYGLRCPGSHRLSDWLKSDDFPVQYTAFHEEKAYPATISVRKFAGYFDEDHAKLLPRGVMALNLDEHRNTALSDKVKPPHLEDIAWGASLNAAPHLRIVQISATGFFTPFHADFLATSSYFYLHRGIKWFIFIEDSFTHYAELSKGFLSQSYINERCRLRIVKVVQGQCLLIPTGCIHAVYTEMDSIALSGNFWSDAAIQWQVKSWKLELARTLGGTDLSSILEHCLNSVNGLLDSFSPGSAGGPIAKARLDSILEFLEEVKRVNKFPRFLTKRLRVIEQRLIQLSV